MIITEHIKKESAETIAHNDDSDLHKDELGENTGDDTGLAKAQKEGMENKNQSSNKQQGPAGENL